MTNEYRLLSLKNRFGIKDLKGLVELKSALMEVNNMVTYEITKKAIEWLYNKIGGFDLQVALDSLNNQSMNANGYDIELPDIVAEVKCNIPETDFTYGSSQKSRIREDIKGLTNGKVKSKKNPKEHYKFLFLLNCPGAEEALAKMKLYKSYNNVVVLDENITQSYSKDLIYIVFIGE